MKFNSLLIIGAVLSCFGLLMCLVFFPLSISGVMFQDHTKFLTTSHSALGLSEGDNSTLPREQILEMLYANVSLLIEPSFSYQQLLPHDRSQYITPTDTIVSAVTSSVFQNPLNRSDINEIWTDLHTIFKWVQSNIRYHNDSYQGDNGILLTEADVWQFPNQTILLGTGDCEDQALLLASLALNYGDATFYVECLFLQSLEGIGHVAMYLPIAGDSICILDPATGYITTAYNDNVLTSQPIEQEMTHYLQFLSQVSNDEWSVSGVFSQDFTLQFLVTEEFTEWLIERIP